MKFKFYDITNGSHDGKDLYTDPHDWKKIFLFCLNKANSFNIDFLVDSQFDEAINLFSRLTDIKITKNNFFVFDDEKTVVWKEIFSLCLNKADFFIVYLPLDEMLDTRISLFSKLTDVKIVSCETHKKYIEISGMVTDKARELIYNLEKPFFSEANKMDKPFTKCGIQLLSNNKELLNHTYDNIRSSNLTNEELQSLINKGININQDDEGDKTIEIDGKMTKEAGELFYKFEKPFFYSSEPDDKYCNLVNFKFYVDNREILFVRASFMRSVCFNETELKGLNDKNICTDQWLIFEGKEEYEFPKDTFTYREIYGNSIPDEMFENIPEIFIEELNKI